jgi:hypothetical protein
VLAAQLKLPVARIRGKRVNEEVVELVPVELAEKHRCLPLFMKDVGGTRELFLAMEDPSDMDAQAELGFRIGFRIKPVLVAPTELEDALQRHYHWSAVAGTASTPLAPLAQRGKDAAELPPAEKPDEPFEDTEPELAAAAAAAAAPIAAPEDSAAELSAPEAPAAEESGDTQPDPPDIERAAAELGSFEAPVARPAAPRVIAPAPARKLAPLAEPEPRGGSAAMTPDVILRALSQLLVEKGLLSRDELVERLRVLATKESERKQA